MEKLKGLALLEKLCAAFGPTSCEYEVANIVKEQVKGCFTDDYTDFIGDYIVHIKGKTDKKLMISAHMDEVGMMISDIDENGYLFFETVGGIDAKVLCGRRVRVGNYGGEKYSGLIASRSVHVLSAEERKVSTPIDKMYIDIGALDKADAESRVSIGDYAVFDSDFVYFGDDMVKGKAIDDRLGCAVMCDLINYINENNITPEFDLYFCFTTREEVGRSGAILAANRVKPDMALVLESTAIADIAEVPEHKRAAKTGDGACISMMDNGTVYFVEMVDFAISLGEKSNVSCQRKKYVAGGTDAAHIHKSVGGVKVINMACPTRYIHSASCVINKNDYASMYGMAKAIALCFPDEAPIK